MRKKEMLSLLAQPAVPLGRSVPALAMKGRELKTEEKEQINLIWAVSPVPRAPGLCSHLSYRCQEKAGKCSPTPLALPYLGHR